MRLLDAPATVTLTRDGHPAAVAWRDPRDPPRAKPRPRRVTVIIDTWRYDGRWWEEHELHRDYYLIELDGSVQAEVYRQDGRWWVARVSD